MDTVKITNITPMFTSLIVTADKYVNDVCSDGGLVMVKKGDIKPYQTVVAVGPNVSQVKPGMKVMLDVKRFCKPVHGDGGKDSLRNVMKDDLHVVVDMDVVEINGVPHFLIQDRDIAYIFEGEETENVNNNPSGIITPESKLIL